LPIYKTKLFVNKFPEHSWKMYVDSVHIVYSFEKPVPGSVGTVVAAAAQKESWQLAFQHPGDAASETVGGLGSILRITFGRNLQMKLENASNVNFKFSTALL
jgi:hypothetical protein